MLKKIKLYKLVLLAIAAFILLDAIIAIGLRVAIFVVPVVGAYWLYKKYKYKQSGENLDPETANKFKDPLNDIINGK